MRLSRWCDEMKLALPNKTAIRERLERLRYHFHSHRDYLVAIKDRLVSSATAPEMPTVLLANNIRTAARRSWPTSITSPAKAEIPDSQTPPRSEPWRTPLYIARTKQAQPYRVRIPGDRTQARWRTYKPERRNRHRFWVLGQSRS